MKYLLVREDEDGVEQLWGRCAGVEGLFAGPVPPPREVLTLRGCRPDGLLSDALAGPDVSLQGLGDVRVEVWDDEQPVRWWTLVDAVMVAHQPHPADPARYDIVLGAGLRNEESFFELPSASRFELFAGATGSAASAGWCSAVDGLFKSHPDPTPVPMELIGCELNLTTYSCTSRRSCNSSNGAALRSCSGEVATRGHLANLRVIISKHFPTYDNKGTAPPPRRQVRRAAAARACRNP
ncbi:MULTISPECIES: hypothetical protein [unclassified Kitasatospora]|uniref:hypothetical protein n=1 Tax=unclassified Kitasatospora TaxID=2633591 RepID=UPI001F388395|nr:MULTISPECIES: hypothetical protein [unclassified Kitasatospora]